MILLLAEDYGDFILTAYTIGIAIGAADLHTGLRSPAVLDRTRVTGMTKQGHFGYGEQNDSIDSTHPP